PGGVSQRTCQSPCTDLTVPCAATGPALSAHDPTTAIALATSRARVIAPMVRFLEGWPRRSRRALSAESPLPCGILRLSAYMLLQPCQERGKAAAQGGKPSWNPGFRALGF